MQLFGTLNTVAAIHCVVRRRRAFCRSSLAFPVDFLSAQGLGGRTIPTGIGCRNRTMIQPANCTRGGSSCWRPSSQKGGQQTQSSPQAVIARGCGEAANAPKHCEEQHGRVHDVFGHPLRGPAGGWPGLVHVWGRTPRASTSDGALSYGASLAGNKRGRLIRRGSRGARVGKGLQQASRGSSTA